MNLGRLKVDMMEQRALMESIEASRPNTTNDEQIALELHCQLNDESTKSSECNYAVDDEDCVQENFCDSRIHNDCNTEFYESEVWRDIPMHERSLADGSCFFDSVRMCLHALGHWKTAQTSEKIRKHMIKMGRRYLNSNEEVEHTGFTIRAMISRDAKSLTEDEAVDDWFERMSRHNVPSDEICITIISKMSNTTIVIQHEDEDGNFLYESATRAWGVHENTKKLYLRYRPQHYVPMMDRLVGRDESRRTVARERFSTDRDAGLTRDINEEGSARITTNRELRANAAEKRITNDPLSDHRVKQELIGKLEGMYKLRNLEIPFGLRSLSVHQLKLRIQAMKK